MKGPSTSYSSQSLFSSFSGTTEMNEALLQYIWQLQYFNTTGLFTSGGEPLEILSPGQINRHQGPDFGNALVRIGPTIFAGSVELHLKTSQWKEHGHEADENYRNVVLHVVLEDDDPNSRLPVLELKSRIPRILLDRYARLMNAPFFIPCSGSVEAASEIIWTSWKERLLAERLSRRSKQVFQFLEENQAHWEESFWWMLGRNFGARVNTDAFEAVVRSIPFNIIGKHRNQIHHLEALLLGQANLLHTSFSEDYPRLLQREYRFLKKKYGLKPVFVPVHFLRMRPRNFPTIRLAQLAALVQQSDRLFSTLLEIEEVSAIRQLFSVRANDYWHYHYLFDQPSSFKEKSLGQEMIENIIINTAAPAVFAYGLYHKEERFKERALAWMEQIGPENNSVIRGFQALGVSSKSAFDSQALIELKSHYCDHKLCLKCAIGTAILKQSPA